MNDRPDSPPVLYSVEGRVATITLNRPERRNGMIRPMVYRLHALLEQVAADPAVSVVVLTGAGSAFCVGADIGGAREAPPPPGFDEGQIFHLGRMLHELPQVTIAAINGACAGAGLAWACACDIRVAAEGAVFSTAFLNVAVAGDMGAAWTLPRLLGSAKARELFFFPEKFPAAEALEIGLVWRVFPDASFHDDAATIARTLGARSPGALRAMKANFLSAERMDFAGFTGLEVARHAELIQSADVKEAFAAFLEKRQPRFG